MTQSIEKVVTRDVAPSPDQWPLRVFEKSVLKQEKYAHILSFLGDTTGLDCLDIGSETGAISYLLRSRGGNWRTTDHERLVVESIRDLVGNGVYLMPQPHLPFADNSFDRIVVVDILEHVENDDEFIGEIRRILRSGGELILNSPRTKPGLLSRFQDRMGLTDEALGRVRGGYTEKDMESLLYGRFVITSVETYRGFFSKLFESLCLVALRRFPTVRMEKHAPMVSKAMVENYGRLVRLYSLVYPLVRAFCWLDRVVPGKGYMLIVKARPIADT